MQIQNSVILITGATAGIGKAIAQNCAANGAKLVLTGRRRNRLDQLHQELELDQSRLLCLPGDIRDEAFCRSLIAQAHTHFGRLDVLINNAGIGHASGLLDISTKDLKTIWETNVYAVSWLSQAAINLMQDQTPEEHTGKRGQIINVSSIIDNRPLLFQSIYSASKSAVTHYSRGLRMECAQSDITISILYPGLTATEFHDAKLGLKTGPQFRKLGLTPKLVAERVNKAINKQKQEIFVTWYDLFFVLANRFAPHLLDIVFRYVANKKD